MLTLSPAKILVVLVIALIVLGPEKLPGMARQIGGAWGDLRRFRARLETEVRDVFPDLPPAHHVAQAVRSPLAFLDRLADEHERAQASAQTPSSPTGDRSEPLPEPPPDAPAPPGATAPPPPAPVSDGLLPAVPDDPSMN